MTIAATILAQLGGNKFVVMTGAKNLMSSGDALSMQLPRNSSKANRLKIRLDANDTYTMEFSRYANLDVKPVKSVAGVYADQLREIFTSVTGMDTAL